MNAIVFLCGSNSAGKTTTLRHFFDIKGDGYSPSKFVSIPVNDRIVCAVSFSSSQEYVQSKNKENFCKFELIIENVKKRIEECGKETKGAAYILLVPFTMSTKKGEKDLNKDCIIKPIRFFKGKISVFVCYIQKEKTHYKEKKDALMRQAEAFFIEPKTTKMDCNRATELETYLKTEVMRQL